MCGEGANLRRAAASSQCYVQPAHISRESYTNFACIQKRQECYILHIMIGNCSFVHADARPSLRYKWQPAVSNHLFLGDLASSLCFCNVRNEFNVGERCLCEAPIHPHPGPCNTCTTDDRARRLTSVTELEITRHAVCDAHSRAFQDGACLASRQLLANRMS